MPDTSRLIQGMAYLRGFLMLLPAQARAQSVCDGILRDGIFNTYSYIDIRQSHAEFMQKYCSKFSDTQKRATSIVGQSSDYVMSFGQSNSDDKRSELCQATGGQTDDSRFTRAMSSVADVQVGSAWSHCMESGVFMSTSKLEGRLVPISISFQSHDGLFGALVTEPPVISGATCQSLPQKGTRITTAVRTAICTRSNKEPVVVVLNTDRGSALLYSPSPRPEPYMITFSGRSSVPNAQTFRFSFPVHKHGSGQDISLNPWAFTAPRAGRLGIAASYELSDRTSYVSCGINLLQASNLVPLNASSESDTVGNKQIRSCAVDVSVNLQKGDRIGFTVGQAGFTVGSPALDVVGELSIAYAD